MQKLSSNKLVTGLNLSNKPPERKPCDGCLMGKQHRLHFPKKSNNKSADLLDLIHSDVCGPMNVVSLGGARFFMTVIDDYSRYHSVVILKTKDEALDKFREFVNLQENRLGTSIKKFRSDNGGEYISKEFERYLKDKGIAQNNTVRYTPQQN